MLRQPQVTNTELCNVYSMNYGLMKFPSYIHLSPDSISIYKSLLHSDHKFVLDSRIAQ